MWNAPGLLVVSHQFDKHLCHERVGKEAIYARVQFSLTRLDSNPTSTTYKLVKHVISPGFYFLTCKVVTLLPHRVVLNVICKALVT